MRQVGSGRALRAAGRAVRRPVAQRRRWRTGSPCRILPGRMGDPPYCRATRAIHARIQAARSAERQAPVAGRALTRLDDALERLTAASPSASARLSGGSQWVDARSEDAGPGPRRQGQGLDESTGRLAPQFVTRHPVSIERKSDEKMVPHLLASS